MPTPEPLSPRNVYAMPEKIMQTFRLRADLVAYLKAESRRCGLDATAFVTRVLDGFRTHYGLPRAARAVLEEDRQALGMEPDEYLLHVLFQRQLEIRERGAGVDAPHGLATSGGAGHP